MQGIDKLHQSVIKGAPTPTVLHKKPSLDSSKDSQLRLSFLDGKEATTSTPRQSTDYSDQWPTDLPSPLELLANSEEGILKKLPDNLRDFPNAGSGTIEDQTFDRVPLEGFNLSQSDNDRHDVEAALVGLSNSMVVQGQSDPPTTDVNSGNVNDPSLPVLSVPDHTAECSRTHKIQSTIPDKRSVEDAEGPVEDSNLGPRRFESKRQKPNSNRDIQARLTDQPSNDNADTRRAPPTPIPVIKPGLPAWVYDFDPAFIAEYQDIVDFV